MFPTYKCEIVGKTSSDPILMMQTAQAFYSEALDAARQIVANTMSLVEKPASVGDVCIRNLEIIDRLWRPYRIHLIRPTT